MDDNTIEIRDEEINVEEIMEKDPGEYPKETGFRRIAPDPDSQSHHFQRIAIRVNQMIQFNGISHISIPIGMYTITVTLSALIIPISENSSLKDAKWFTGKFAGMLIR